MDGLSMDEVARLGDGFIPRITEDDTGMPRPWAKTFYSSAPYGRGLVLPDSFCSQRVASQKRGHSLPSRGAEKTCQSSLR